MPDSGVCTVRQHLCFPDKRLPELSNSGPSEGPSGSGFTPGCGWVWPPPAELGKGSWGFPGAFVPSYTWTWFPLIELFTYQWATQSFPGKAQVSPPTRQPLLAGELGAPFPKRWQFTLPRISSHTSGSV